MASYMDLKMKMVKNFMFEIIKKLMKVGAGVVA